MKDCLRIIKEVVKSSNKKFKGYGVTRNKLVSVLKSAHPIVFDSSCTRESEMESGIVKVTLNEYNRVVKKEPDDSKVLLSILV